jgi:hypothetical protein
MTENVYELAWRTLRTALQRIEARHGTDDFTGALAHETLVHMDEALSAARLILAEVEVSKDD